MLIPKRQLIFYLFTSMLIYPASSIAAIFLILQESKPVGNEGQGLITLLLSSVGIEPPTALNPCYKKRLLYNHKPSSSALTSLEVQRPELF